MSGLALAKMSDAEIVQEVFEQVSTVFVFRKHISHNQFS